MKGPPKKATTNIEVAGSAASHGLTLLIYMTCCQLVPSMSLRHFQVGAKKQGIMVTFTEWNLLKWPYWLQVLPLTLMWMILIAEMMGSEPLHTWPMFLHSQGFNEFDTSLCSSGATIKDSHVACTDSESQLLDVNAQPLPFSTAFQYGPISAFLHWHWIHEYICRLLGDWLQV